MRSIVAGPGSRDRVRTALLPAGLLLLLMSVMAHGQYELTWSSTTGGGGHSTGGQYSLLSTMGSYTTVMVFPEPDVPTPDPMEWATAPHAINSSSVAMTAIEAVNPGSAVEYYFENVTVTDGSHDSGWQAERTYTDTDLSADTVYEYRVKARGSNPDSDTAYSVALPAKTPPATPGGVPEGSAEPVSGDMGSDLNLQVDPFTGSVNYTVPISLPPGRQGSEPSLALRYGGGGNGWCGVGWSLGMGAIQRDTRRGVPVARDSSGQYEDYYDDEKGFVVAFGAVNSRLVKVNAGTSEYRAETDQAFLKYVFDRTNNQWIVTDKSGNKFYFGEVAGENQGETAGAMMEHPQFDSTTNSENTFLWSLAKIQDINGNLTYVYYAEDGNQIYLDEIRYNGHTQGLPTTSSVRFSLDPTDRSDKSVSYATGYRVESNRRLTDIAVWVYDYNQSNWTRVRRYHLDYEQSSSTLRSLLASVTRYGTSDTNHLPPVTFEYQEKALEFERDGNGNPIWQTWPGMWSRSSSENGANANMISGNSTGGSTQNGRSLTRLLDIDGDALPDRILEGMTYADNYFAVQRNTGSSFTTGGDLLQWGPVRTVPNLVEGSLDFVHWHGLSSFKTHYPLIGNDVESFGRVDLADMNGDGYVDRLVYPPELSSYLPDAAAGENFFYVQLGTGSGLEVSESQWGPLDVANGAYSYWTRTKLNHTNVALLDINGDGMPDRVMAGQLGDNSFKVQLNTGSGFERTSSGSGGGTDFITLNWGPTDDQNVTGLTEIREFWNAISATNEGATQITMADLNGDGLADRIMRERTKDQGGDPAGYDVFRVQFNTGYGFERDSTGTNPVTRDWGPLHSQDETNPGWSSVSAFDNDDDGPIYAYAERYLYVDLLDINGDGLPDRVMQKESSPHNEFVIQINTGSGFSSEQTWHGVAEDYLGATTYVNHDVYASSEKNQDRIVLVDINGDGLVDRVMACTDHFKVQLNKGPLPDKLLRVQGRLGATAEVTYTSSTQHDNRDHNGIHRLPFPVPIVSSVTIDNQMGNQATTTYDYSRGLFDSTDREFRGFGKVEVTDPVGIRSVTFFHQGGGYEDATKGEFQDADSHAKKGMPCRVEVYGSNGQLYSITTNKVEEVQLAQGCYHAYIAQTLKLNYSGVTFDSEQGNYSTAYRAHLTQYGYDLDTTGGRYPTGNLLKVTDLREVRVGESASEIQSRVANHTWSQNVDLNDDTYVHTTYATQFWNGSSWIQNSEIQNKIEDTWVSSDSAGANILKATSYSYDLRGRVLTEESWLDKTADGPLGAGGSGIYTEATEYAYDAYGNRNWSKGKDGIETSTTYDSAYHIYPETKQTATFVTSLAFDPLSGLPIQVVEPDGTVCRHEYDEFFRLTASYFAPSLQDSEIQLTQVDYTLAGITGGNSYNYVHQMHNGYEAYTYNDGLGRVIQTRIKAETGAAGEYRVLGRSYDIAGRVSIVSLPFFDDATSYLHQNSWLTQVPVVETQYDAIGLIARTITPTGQTTYAYQEGPQLSLRTVTDPEGKVTSTYLDIAGRTISIVEPGSITTGHVYDLLGRRIKTIDHAGNEFETEFDSLDRKIRSIDPDMGTWTYTYDDANRMTEQVDARGNRIQFAYSDPLGRVTQKTIKDHSDTTVETVSYTYDQSDDPDYTVSKGQLYKVTDGQGWTKMSYDTQGREVKNSHHLSVNGKTYTTQTDYDEADRITQVNYPDNKAVIAYGYDDRGNLAKVESLWGTGANEVFYQAQTFNADEQPVQTTFGNGTTSTYTYHSLTRRLQQMTSQRGSTTLQDISYTYDSVSNVTSITDNLNTTGAASSSCQNIQYDDLYRLTSLYSVGEATTITYEYNALGNIHRNGEMGTGEYTYHATKPHVVVSANGNSYTYDACGNMTTRNSSEHGNQTLTYDERNQLVQVAISGGSTVQFGYSAGGSRLWKKVGGQVTGLWIGDIYEEKNGEVLCHVYAGGRLVATFEPEGALACIIQNNRYLAALYNNTSEALMTVFGHGRAPLSGMGIAILVGLGCGIVCSRKRLWRVHGLASPTAPRLFFRQLLLMCLVGSILLSGIPQAAYATPTYDPAFYYYHPDHLGSSQLMTDRSGEIVQHYGYQPYGSERYRDNTNAFDVSNRYTGHYYYGARYYDPEVARFIQADSTVPDPEFSQAYNRYAYVYNNPLKFTDPTGHFPLMDMLIAPLLIPAGRAIASGIAGAVAASNAGVNPLLGLLGGVAASIPGSLLAFSTTITLNVIGNGMLAATTAGGVTVYLPPITGGVAIYGSDPTPYPFNDPAVMKEWRRRNYEYRRITRTANPAPIIGRWLLALEFHMAGFPGEALESFLWGAFEMLSFATMGMSSGTSPALNYSDDIAVGLADDVVNYADDVTARLQSHVSRAAREVDALGDDAFTLAQRDAVRIKPRLRPMYRGNRIDVRARRYVKGDPNLDFLKGSYNRSPDFVDPITGKWWDMTTPGQWPIHVQKYGPGGTLLPTR